MDVKSRIQLFPYETSVGDKKGTSLKIMSLSYRKAVRSTVDKGLQTLDKGEQVGILVEVELLLQAKTCFFESLL
jgi:hypothetical protein